MNQLRLQLM